MRRIILLVGILSVCIPITFANAKQTPSTQQKTNNNADTRKAESKNWRVTLISTEKKDRTDELKGEPRLTKSGHYMLRLTLQVEYLGPDGEVKAPDVIVIDDKDNKYERRGSVQTSPDMEAMKSIFWFLEKKTRPLKSGSRLGEWLAFFFEVPSEATKLKLSFGDVPVVPIIAK